MLEKAVKQAGRKTGLAVLINFLVVSDSLNLLEASNESGMWSI